MQKKLFFTVLCVLFLAACQQTPESQPVAQEAPKPDLVKVKAEIKAVEDAWAAASNSKDVATIVGFYADDAISMNDDQPMLVGKAAIQKGVEAEMARRKEKEKTVFETLDLYGDENRVTEVGKTTVSDSTGKVIYTGKYMAVWEKRNGKWLTIRDMSNDDAKAQ
jgi:ketosteroid isomerase-like protein